MNTFQEQIGLNRIKVFRFAYVDAFPLFLSLVTDLSLLPA
jgi:hypothetical protein